jgi:CheY-like chemotaxis protein
MKILVVDDYPGSAFITGRLLEDRGHEIELAHDGPSGVEKAKITKPDAILVDLNMPGMDGYETCKRMRHNLADTIILAFTGIDNEEIKQLAKEAGFDDVVLKDNINDVEEKIRKSL